MRHPQGPRLESITSRNDDEEGIAAAELAEIQNRLFPQPS
jgi:hypothetical protein